jgi:hypothetical protein
MDPKGGEQGEGISVVQRFADAIYNEVFGPD